MKKAFAVLCCALLCLSLAACGSSSPKTPANKTETPSPSAQENASASAQESIYFDDLGDITPEAVEVVYDQVDMISYQHGWAYFIIFVEVKNVSDQSIRVGVLNSYTLNKADGTVFEEGYFDWSSKPVVAPGETFYLYDYTTSDKVQPEDEVVCVPEVDDAARYGEGNLQTFHEVSDLWLSYTGSPLGAYADEVNNGDRLYLHGTLHCGEVAKDRDITMTCVGYDQSGKPVCMFTEVIKEPESYSDVEFSMSAEVYGSVTAEDLSDNWEVYAYNWAPPEWWGQ